MIFFITRPVVPFPILQSVFRCESNKILLHIQILMIGNVHWTWHATQTQMENVRWIWNTWVQKNWDCIRCFLKYKDVNHLWKCDDIYAKLHSDWLTQIRYMQPYVTIIILKRFLICQTLENESVQSWAFFKPVDLYIQRLRWGTAQLHFSCVISSSFCSVKIRCTMATSTKVSSSA